MGIRCHCLAVAKGGRRYHNEQQFPKAMKTPWVFGEESKGVGDLPSSRFLEPQTPQQAGVKVYVDQRNIPGRRNPEETADVTEPHREILDHSPIVLQKSASLQETLPSSDLSPSPGPLCGALSHHLSPLSLGWISCASSICFSHPHRL